MSGPGLAADHQRHGGVRLDGARIVAGAASDDGACRASLDRYTERLARALASVINIVDPDAVVLGGGLSAIAELYDAVPRLWGRYVFSNEVVTPLLPPRHGDSSGVRGAAWLWRPEEAG